MKAHTLALASETYNGTQILFRCACGAEIAFAREGDGEPYAKQVDGVWMPPPAFMRWMGPCEEPQAVEAAGDFDGPEYDDGCGKED